MLNQYLDAFKLKVMFEVLHGATYTCAIQWQKNTRVVLTDFDKQWQTLIYLGRPLVDGFDFLWQMEVIDSFEEQHGRESFVRADFGQRFGAHLIDSVLVVTVIVLLAWGYVKLLSVAVDGDNETMGKAMVLSGIFLYFFGPIIIRTIYGTLFECSKMQATPGKRVVGLKVVDQYGDKLSFSKSLSRNLAKIVSALIFYFGYLMVLFNRDKRSMHDRITDTSVIECWCATNDHYWFDLLCRL